MARKLNMILYQRSIYTSMNHGIYLQSAIFQLRITSGISLPFATESTLLVLGQTGQQLLVIGSQLGRTEP
uniref:Uncharacterized protein n=1 Tax=Arundo donax TaxID=35708 RepID=A0A0A9DTL4_ARUDO